MNCVAAASLHLSDPAVRHSHLASLRISSHQFPPFPSLQAGSARAPAGRKMMNVRAQAAATTIQKRDVPL